MLGTLHTVFLICEMVMVAPPSGGCGTEASTAETRGASGHPAAVAFPTPFLLQIPLLATRGRRAAPWHMMAQRCSRVSAERPLAQWPWGLGVPASVTDDRTRAGLFNLNTSLGQAGAMKVWGLELLLVPTPVLVPPSSNAQGLGMALVSVGSREAMCPSSDEAGLG